MMRTVPYMPGLLLTLVWLLAPAIAGAAISPAGMVAGEEALAQPVRSPYDIIAQAPEQHWRGLNPDNTLYIELATGTVVVELLPEIAPRQSANFGALVRSGFYDGLSIYRVVDGFVAQGGDTDNVRDTGAAKRQLPGEFVHSGGLPYVFIPVDAADGFANESGYMHGFALGRVGQLQWLLHCPGAFALARDEAPNSGGTEFYMVLGQAPRYLDRNVTVFGTVRYGMQHLQKLNRGKDGSGVLEVAERNPIVRMRVGVDVPVAERLNLQVMRTGSASFAELVSSRSRRPEPWFVFQPGYVDVCSVPVPVRLQ